MRLRVRYFAPEEPMFLDKIVEVEDPITGVIIKAPDGARIRIEIIEEGEE